MDKGIKVLKQFKQAIIKRINDPRETNPYNFGYGLSGDSHNLSMIIDDLGDEDLTFALWCQLGVITGAKWGCILLEHFHLKGKVAQYYNRVLNTYLYDRYVKLYDKPVSHKEMLKRIDKAMSNVKAGVL